MPCYKLFLCSFKLLPFFQWGTSFIIVWTNEFIELFSFNILCINIHIVFIDVLLCPNQCQVLLPCVTCVPNTRKLTIPLISLTIFKRTPLLFLYYNFNKWDLNLIIFVLSLFCQAQKFSYSRSDPYTYAYNKNSYIGGGGLMICIIRVFIVIRNGDGEVEIGDAKINFLDLTETIFPACMSCAWPQRTDTT